MRSILFVCTGNICRSPSAEGVLRHKLTLLGHANRFTIDSAGTHGYHIGEPPDPRSIATAKKRGIDISTLRGRKVSAADFERFDLILGLDYEHMRLLRLAAPKHSSAHVALFLEYAGATPETEVPDPYYGNAKDFEHALDLIEAGCDGLIKKLEQWMKE